MYDYYKMIEWVVILGKKLVFISLSSIDVLYHAILHLQTGDDFVFAILNKKVGFAKLGLSERTLLCCCDLSLVIWKHLVGSFEIFCERHEGIKISCNNYIIFFSCISKFDQGIS